MILLIYILFSLLLTINCELNETYISYCEDKWEDEDKNKLNPSKCNAYNPIEIPNSTCCFVKYGRITSYTYTYYYYYKKKNRNLQANYEYYYTCIGISKEGFDNINDVIKQMNDEKKYDSLDIDCFSKYLKKSFIPLLILFF